MERTVIMDKSKGEPVISVKTTSRSKERVSIASATSNPAIFDHFGLYCENIVWPLKILRVQPWPGCKGGFNPWSGHTQELTNECTSKWNNKLMFFSLSFLSLSKISKS